MIGPMTDDTQVSAAANAGGYLPSRVIIVCIILPEAAASASAEPDMLAKMTLCTTLTCASPPRKRPTIALQKCSSLSMMLPVFMNSAYGDSDTVATALARGADEFLTKPVDFPKLRRDIMAVMADATGENG